MIPRILVPAVLAATLLACGDSSVEAAAPKASPAARTAAAEAPRPAAARSRKERPLPAFSGWTLDGQKLSVSDFLGKRLVLFFFNPEVAEASVASRAVKQVSAYRAKHNFEILGIATGSNHKRAQSFAAEQELDFPVIDDSDAAIARRLGLRSPVAMLGIDTEGYVIFGLGQIPTEGPDPEKLVENMLRTSLRLPELARESAPELGTRPPAPDFSAPVLDGDERFVLADHRGRVVVLVFFLHTCPHCHEALRSMRQSLLELPEDKRPLLVGLEVSGRTASVRENLADLGLDFFPVLFDEDGSIQAAYGVFGGVPDIFLIDTEGRIAARVQGWREQTDPALVRMRMAQLAGAKVPLLLSAEGYSGNENCGTCHEEEHATWMFTQHAGAYDSLVKHGAAADPECVSCHVVGYQKTGGFEGPIETPSLENVGCESCHGRGGPHLSPDFVVEGNYEPVCVTCHNPTHSLGFDYASFLPRISHAANRELLALPLEEKRKLLAERGLGRTELLPTSAAIVGSEACASCHAAEFATWSESPHAHAGATLQAAPKGGDPACLACHTTGTGREGGFPKGGRIADHPDLGRVGCESCHGPGGDHIPETAPKVGTIVSLGDKCDSCVILKICGSCHDDANDPGFEFEVVEKIEKQRHGTVEAGTGKPLERGTHRAPAAPQAAAGGRS